MADRPLPVICLAGPTGTGKTDLAIRLANSWRGEIINGDSRQLYASFPIITAQPDACQRAQAPHHLYGILGARERMNVGVWISHVVAMCQQVHHRGHLPIIVGGTGFYFEGLLNGLSEMPVVPQHISDAVAMELATRGPQVMHQELARVDESYARRIHGHDKQRIQRALEVYRASGRPFSWWQNQGRLSFPVTGPLMVVDFGLDALAPRLAARVQQMWEAGALAEVEAAFKECPDEGAPGWSAIGARELLAHWQGRMDEAECQRRWFRATRAYAKRQLTWFRGRPNAVWIKPDVTPEELESLHPEGATSP